MSFLDEVQSPPKAFSPNAFWFWYGDLKPERLRWQINEMADKGVYNGFMHARAYLKTPYLEQEWWDAVSACVEEGEKTGFHPWLYDEYAWPSGTAGSTFEYGFQKPSPVLAKGICNMAKSLEIRRYASANDFQLTDTSFSPLYLFQEKNGEMLRTDPEHLQEQGQILVFSLKIHPRNVDYLNRNTIRLFMDYTHEEYKKRYGQFFGNRIPGIFFDEIYMRAEAFPWTDCLAEEFQKRRGYDLIPKLPALATAGGEQERQIRKDYYQTIAELYEEAFFTQISEWCEENHLKLTGHTEEHLAGHPGRQGNYFDTIRHLQIPGADNHDYRYRFPRKITYCEPKYSVSVARAYGKERAMSEAMGGAGWGCSLQQFKRGVNTMGVMGISMFTLHGFYSECEHQGSQSDWPTSFFYQNPYWRYFRQFADYISRICYMNTLGKPVVDVGLYYPIEQMQAETVAGKTTPAGVALDQAFTIVLNTLLEHQIDTDMIDSRCLLSAEVSKGKIRTGVQSFRILLFPEPADLPQSLEQKLKEFEQNGGIILRYSCTEFDGGISPTQLPAVIAEKIQPDVQILRGTRNNLFASHRVIEGKDCYLISNSSPNARFTTLLLRAMGSIRKLSPETGTCTALSGRIVSNGTEIDLWLEPDEACWLILDPEDATPFVSVPEIREEIAVAGRWEFLPISSELSGSEQLLCQNTTLQIPLAILSSDTHPAGKRIRICNTNTEPGFCGRHLSLWEASWITRRPAWQDDCSKPDLYFRKLIHLDQIPKSARICIAAVQEWTLWINGKKAVQSAQGLEPMQADLSGCFTEGENLLAIQVHNPKPLSDHNVCSAETLPPDRLTSLLLQVEICSGDDILRIISDSSWIVSDSVPDGWDQLSYQPHVRHLDASACSSFGDGARQGEWLEAWERGCPPLQPWGDLPLFGEKISYPQQLVYNLTIPAGTKQIAYPDVTGSDCSITLDGMELTWKNGKALCKPDGIPHHLEIRITAQSEKDGLHQPIQVTLAPFRTALFDWRLHGLEWYSGFARYQNTVWISKKPGCYLLNLGDTAFQAEIWINDVYAGSRVWQPYRLDVTDLLHDGENQITVIVSNSAAVERQFLLVDEGMALGWNRYWNNDNIQREGENLVSGLLGPVQIQHLI
ncbi:MAG: glycosyl hydrolase [Candidatus Merdivicinus sp.]|jgi:hypothetical protein